MQKFTPFLWFDTQVEEAANFYTAIFPNSTIVDVSHYPEGTPGPAGEVMVVSFELNGQRFTALNGGPIFKFNEAVSFMIDCEDQEEVDYYWNKFTEGGEESQCGWLKDKCGLSWQVVPKQLVQLMSAPDKDQADRTMQALLKMKKLDFAVLQKAHDGE